MERNDARVSVNCVRILDAGLCCDAAAGTLGHAMRVGCAAAFALWTKLNNNRRLIVRTRQEPFGWHQGKMRFAFAVSAGLHQ